MHRIMLAAIFGLGAAPALADDRTFIVTDFDRVQVDGPFEVRLITGRPASARAEGSTHALDQVSIDVEGRQLRVRPNRSAWGGYPGENAGPVTITLTTRDLRAAFVRGSGGIDINNVIGLRFDLGISGSGRIAIGKLQADTANVSLFGSGTVTLAGKAKTFQASIQGSGDLDARALMADDAEINSGTAGNITVGVQRAARVTGGGPGDVTILGAPACTVAMRGSGRVRCGKDG